MQAPVFLGPLAIGQTNCGVGHKCPLWRHTYGVLWRQAFSLHWRAIKQSFGYAAIKEVYLRRHKANLLAPLCLFRAPLTALSSLY